MDLLRKRMPLPDILAALWREDEGDVAVVYDTLAVRYLGDEPGLLDGRHGLQAERMRELRRPDGMAPKRGLTISDLADHGRVARDDDGCRSGHHGYLELVTYGGGQRRRVLTERAVEAGYGHNADAAHVRIGHVEGHNRASVFPVVYPECAAAILWTLNIPGIRADAAMMPMKRDRLRWLLAQHGYMPAAFVAELTGCTVRAVEKARARGAAADEVRLEVIGGNLRPCRERRPCVSP
jgi:hypothetical protein